MTIPIDSSQSMLQCIINESYYADNSIGRHALMRNHAQPDIESLLRCGVTMICAGTLVSAIGSLMVRPAFQRDGYIAVVLLIATCFVVALSFVRLKDRRTLSRPMAIAYVGVSSVMVCYMTVSVLPSSSSGVPVAGMLAGLLGLYWAASLMAFA